MLMSDFYTVHELQSSNDRLSCLIVFNQTHRIFEGHFPQQPVVPGVCTIQIVKELLEQQLDRKLILRSASQVKFLQLITPDIVPEVSISWKQTGETYSVNAVLKKDKDLFKFSGMFDACLSVEEDLCVEGRLS
jgi:3-hydroxyacyl-[acyl-carrier-protein] dehydratase